MAQNHARGSANAQMTMLRGILTDKARLQSEVAGMDQDVLMQEVGMYLR